MTDAGGIVAIPVRSGPPGANGLSIWLSLDPIGAQPTTVTLSNQTGRLPQVGDIVISTHQDSKNICGHIDEVKSVESVQVTKTGKLMADLTAADIPNLPASKINSGTLDAARIPSLPPSKITQDASNRFTTDAEKTSWNAAATNALAALQKQSFNTMNDFNTWAAANPTYIGKGQTFLIAGTPYTSLP